MIVQHNIAAFNANRALGINERNKNRSLEKLNSGYRINRAADDAAGLAITEEMRGQIRGLNRAVYNITDGIGYVQTADSALSEIHDILHRIHELAVQSVNDTNMSQDREYIDMEVQLLKDEIDRIFDETEFNTIPIWNTNTSGRVQIGTADRQAVTMTSNSQTLYVNEVNKGAVAHNGYTIEVQGTDPDDPDNYGFKVTWEGWNTTPYSTELVPWEDVGTGAFSMRISDYFGASAPAEIAGIDFRLGWNTADPEIVTVDDIAMAINGRRFGSSVYSDERTENNQISPGVSCSVSTNYLAELACDRNTEHYDTVWIEPRLSGSTNVPVQPSYTDPREERGWEIHFTMPNIGNVTARSNSISYYGNDTRDEKENIFWRWYSYTSNGVTHKYKSAISHTPGAGSAGSLHALTDCSSNDLDANSLQNSQGGGTIYMNLTVTPDSGTVNYRGRTTNTIGTLTFTISVSQSDDEEAVMRKIQAALNPNTVLDVYRSESNRSYQTISSPSAGTNTVKVPVYKSTINMYIQAGANANQLIDITYDSLRVYGMGMQNTNVLNQRAAANAIAEVQAAEDMIAEQRSIFGSYQNRFEHAAEVAANTSENLQASESYMRDTDMADEMVRLSCADILSQAGQAMLAQANRMTDGVLELIRLP